MNDGEFVCGYPFVIYSSATRRVCHFVFVALGDPMSGMHFTRAGVQWIGVLNNAVLAFYVLAVTTYVCEYCEPVRRKGEESKSDV